MTGTLNFASVFRANGSVVCLAQAIGLGWNWFTIEGLKARPFVDSSLSRVPHRVGGIAPQQPYLLYFLFSITQKWKINLHEKGGKEHDMPVHHKLEEYLDAYIEAAGGFEAFPEEPKVGRENLSVLYFVQLVAGQER